MNNEKADRVYNGPSSVLMNDLYDIFNQHSDIHDHIDAIGTLYLARVCKELEQMGWIKGEK